VYDRKDQFTIYYVEEAENCHVLSRYDVATRTKTSARVLEGNSILDVAISEKILVLLQTSSGLVLGQLSPDSFESGHLNF